MKLKLDRTSSHPRLWLSLLPLCLALLALTGCGSRDKRILNTANLDLDIGIGISHFEDDGDYPAPSKDAYLDIYNSHIIIRDAYPGKTIETPLLHNNSSTAHPRKQLYLAGNRLYVIYCPDISLPTLQIVSTNDGGQNWEQTTLALDTLEIGTIDTFVASFWSSRAGALLIANGMVDTFLYTTQDAGQTWQRVAGAPPSRDWHESLYTGGFLSDHIGVASYAYYSCPPDRPQAYLTLDGGLTWEEMGIKVPASIMDAYALVGTPFYDGEKINLPIELYDAEDTLTNTVYYVSYDLGGQWEYFVDDNGALEQIRLHEMEDWFAANRPDALRDLPYTVTDFSVSTSFDLEEDIRIDAYALSVGYDVEDWSQVHLTREMFFDEDMRLCYEDWRGTPLLLFAYEGDVFDHTYTMIGAAYRNEMLLQGESTLAEQLYENMVENRAAQTLFDDACRAYSYFTPYSPAITSSDVATYGDALYEKVTLDGIETTLALRDYLSTFFTEDIVDTLMATYVETPDTPLFVDIEEQLYRYADIGVAPCYTAVVSKISPMTDAADGTPYLRVTLTDTLGDRELTLSYDCRCEEREDGLRLATFRLPIDYLLHYEPSGEEILDDHTEAYIRDIAYWDDLHYVGYGNEAIRQFLTAFLEGDAYGMAMTGTSSDYAVYETYADFVIGDYIITKTYQFGNPVLTFTFALLEEAGSSYLPAAPGEYTLLVSVSANGVLLSPAAAPSLSEAGRFLADYYEEVLDYALPDFGNLNYQQTYDVSEFLLRRMAASEAEETAVGSLADTIFGVHDFKPSEALRTENGTTFAYQKRGKRQLAFRILEENALRTKGMVSVTVQFYADMAELIPARTIEYQLTAQDGQFRLERATLLHSSVYRIGRYTES